MASIGRTLVVFDLIILMLGGLGTARGKLVGGKSVLTSLDKSNI